jgi:hypothetical protein
MPLSSRWTALLLSLIWLGSSLGALAQPALLDTDTRVPRGNGYSGDGYGAAVAISADGRTAAVGAPASNGQEGAVHVFQLEGGT